MKAFVFSRKGELELKELPRPVLSSISGGERGALLRPLFLSPCSSDVHTVYAGNGPRRENLVLGHEGLAEILECGNEVRDFRPGETAAVCAVMPEDPVIPESGISGSPDRAANLTGHENRPFSGCKLGRNIEGMWQEAFYVPDADRNLAKLPDGLAPEDALMAVDVMATGFTAAADAQIRKNETVCVIGTGAVGLMAIAAAKSDGAHVIAIGSGRREQNTSLARSLGAEAVISYSDGRLLSGKLPCASCRNCLPERSPLANSTGSAAVDLILDATRGQGVDACIIAGGMPLSLKQACDLIRYGSGRAVNVDYIEGGGCAELPVFSLGRGMAGKSFVFSLSRGGRAWTEEMLRKAGELRPGRLVTSRFSGFESIPEALEIMKEKQPGTIKILIDLTADPAPAPSLH